LYNTDVDKLFEIANMNMSQLSIYDWFTVNRLNLNLDKTCYSTFHANCVDLNKFKLYMDGKEIQRAESCKYLGILIDRDLKWRHHIDYVYSKLVKFISIFYRIRIKLAPEIHRMIYFAFVHPHLLYGIEVNGNTTSNYLSKLIILNNKLLRILQNKSIKTHNSELYKEYCTIPLHLLHQISNFDIYASVCIS